MCERESEREREEKKKKQQTNEPTYASEKRHTNR